MTEELMERKKQKEQKWICATICALISEAPISGIINDIFNLFVAEKFIYDSLICYIVLLFMLVKTLIVVGKNIKRDIIFLLLFMLGAWVFAYVFFEYNKYYMFTSFSDVLENPFYVLFVFSFSGYLFARYITDYDLFEKYFIRFSLAVVISSVASFFITLDESFQKSYMVFSYNMLLQVVCLIVMFFEKKKILYMAVGFLGFMVMFMAGCRGATVCCIASILIYFLFKKNSLAEKLLIGLLAGVFLYFFIDNFNSILSRVSSLVESLGMDSYALRRIQTGEFLNDSGRGEIQKKIIAEFNLFGHGIYGDIMLGGWTYAHNFVIEIIAQFGYLIGIPILAFVFYLLAKGLTSDDGRMRILVAIFMSTGFLKLFLSSSYLRHEPAFYILLALCVNSIQNVNKQEKKRE